MAFVNHTNKKVTARIIYYGPDQAGKNTSLLYIYNHVPEENKGKLVSLVTEHGNKINFEYHPMHFDKSGYSFVVQLNAVSGQVKNEVLRRELVNGADGCVFLADMQPSSQFANFKCYRNLEDDLRACGTNLRDFPLIIQYNKMDVPNILPVGKMNLFLNSYNVQFFETCGLSGEGVLDVLDGITRVVWDDLSAKGMFGKAETKSEEKSPENIQQPEVSITIPSEEQLPPELSIASDQNLESETVHKKEADNQTLEYGELEAIDLSANAEEVDFENADLTVFPFEEEFGIDDLLQLADKIGPKAEQDLESQDSGTTQRIRIESTSIVDQSSREEVVLSGTPFEIQEEPFEFSPPTVEENTTLELEPEAEKKVDEAEEAPVELEQKQDLQPHAFLEPAEPESALGSEFESMPEPANEPEFILESESSDVSETATQAEPIGEPEAVVPAEPAVIAESAESHGDELPEPLAVPEPAPAPEPVVAEPASAAPATELPVPSSAVDSLFRSEPTLQNSFELLEDAISKKDFSIIKQISEEIYSALIDKLCKQKGITRDKFRDGSLWFQEIGIPSGQYLPYQKVMETLSSHSQAALADLFLIHHFLLTLHTRLSGQTELPARPAKKLVAIERVTKLYRLGNFQVQALKNVNMDVKNGEFLAIAGPSGSGKTTLLNLIGCIDTPSSGTITIEDRVVNGLSSDELADLRARTIGFIFQNFNLLPVLSASENVEYPLLQVSEISKAERKERVNHYLSVVHLSSVANHRPNELSGGQRQRVAIARALTGHPKIVLADEPTANLDHKTGESILQLMKEINRLEKTTFIFSTHDPRVMEMADRLIQINDGEIVN